MPKSKTPYEQVLIDPDLYQSLTPKSQDALERLAQHEYKGLNFEQLKTTSTNKSPIFSIRSTQCDRLLLARIRRAGKLYLLVLEEVLHHRYDKAAFLQRVSKLENLLDNITIKLDDEPVGAQEQRVLLKQPMCIYQENVILFDEEQSKAINMPLPVIVHGLPGSGKTCIALKLLRKLSLTNTANPIYYITKLPTLVKHVETAWEQYVGNKEQYSNVKFLSYEDFLKQHLPDDKQDYKCAQEDDYKVWVERWLETQKKLVKIGTRQQSDFIKQCYGDSQLLYKEFRLIAHLEQDAYFAAGKRQCLANAEDDKKIVLEAIAAYLQYLDEKKLFDVAFQYIDEQYSTANYAIVADESQDLTPTQHVNLARSANGQFCFLSDSNQQLFDDLAPALAVLEKTYNIKHASLPVTHRCSKKVANVADKLLQAKNQMRGGIGHKAEKATVKTRPTICDGQIYQIETYEEFEYAWSSSLSSVEFAIITHESFIEEAKRLFNTPLIFTPAQIKGLEYKKVMLYKIFEHQVFYDANKRIDPKNIQRQIHRPKKGMEDAQGMTIWNAVFIAITRAVETLIVFQKKHNRNTNLLNTLFEASQQVVNIIMPASPTKSDDVAWEEEAEKQRKHGNMEVANAILAQQQAPKATVRSPEADEQQENKVKVKVKHKLAEEKSVPKKGLHEQPSSSAKKNIVVSSSSLEQEAQGSDVHQSQKKKRKRKKKNKPVDLMRLAELKKDFKIDEKGLNKILKSANMIERLFVTPYKNLPFSLVSLVGENQIQLAYLCEQIEKHEITVSFDDLRNMRCQNMSVLAWLISFDTRGDNTLSQILLEPLIDDELMKQLVSRCAEGLDSEDDWLFLCYMLNKTNYEEKLYSLFNHIKDKTIKSLYSNLVSKKITHNIPGYTNTSLLFWMMHSEKGIVNFIKYYQFQDERIDDAILVQLFDNNDSFNVTGALPANILLGYCKYYILSKKKPAVMRNKLKRMMATIVDTMVNRFMVSSSMFAQLLVYKSPSLAVEQDRTSFHLSELHNTSIFYRLCDTKRGLKLARTLIEKRMLADSITARQLCVLRDKQAGCYENESVLYSLVSQSEGVKLVLYLFEQNDSLASQITAEAICALRTTQAHSLSNTSVLYWLTINDNGHEILLKLLHANKSLASEITAEALYALRDRDTGDAKNTSAFYFLSDSEKGIKILNLLFEAQPTLIEQVPATTLCAMCQDQNEDEKQQTSVLYWLICSREGKEILQKILAAKQTLAAEITAEALFSLRSKQAKEGGNTSAFYWLSGTHDGANLLQAWFTANPTLMKGVTKDVLCAMPTGNDPCKDTSALYFLSAADSGLTLLNTLFKNQPSLLNEITPESLYTMSKSRLGVFQNTSTFFWLSRKKQGRDLLKMLLAQNTKLITHIMVETLDATVTNRNGKELSARGFLLKNPQSGIEILQMLKQLDISSRKECKHVCYFKNGQVSQVSEGVIEPGYQNRLL